MFKSLSELMTSVGKTDAHKVSIVQVKTGVTSWGRKNQSSRPTAEYQIWMDTPDNDSRIVLKLNFVLSSRRNQPEKNAPLNIEISQYANWDTVKRAWAECAPERACMRLENETTDEFMSTSGVWKKHPSSPMTCSRITATSIQARPITWQTTATEARKPPPYNRGSTMTDAIQTAPESFSLSSLTDLYRTVQATESHALSMMRVQRITSWGSRR